jgi:hypothetical protein
VVVSSAMRWPGCKLCAESPTGWGGLRYLSSGAQDKSRPGRSSVVAVFIGLDGFLVPPSAGSDSADTFHFKDLDASPLRQDGGIYDGRRGR